MRAKINALDSYAITRVAGGGGGGANEALDAFTMSADTSNGGSRSSCHLVPPAALSHKRVPVPSSLPSLLSPAPAPAAAPALMPLSAKFVHRVLPANVNAKCERTFGKQVRANCPEGRRHVAGSQSTGGGGKRERGEGG